MQHAVRSDARAPASGLYALMVAGALALSGCDGSNGQGGATAARAARGHRRQAARAEAGRMDRVHRTVRGRPAGRRPGPGLGLSRDHRLRGRPGRRERPEPVPDRSAAVRGGAGARPGRSRERPGSGRARQAAVRACRQADRQSGLCPDELRSAAAGASGRRGEPGGRAGRRGTGQAQPRLHTDLGADRRADLRPPGRHRQSGHRGDAAHHDRVAEPDLFRLRHERGRLPRLPASRAGGRSCPRPATARPWSTSSWSTRKTGTGRGR